MTFLPSISSYITVQETEFRAPVSESTFQKLGSSNNFLLDHFPVQPGTIHDFAGLEANIPGGYIIGDGRAVSRTTYANLYAAIGTLWGVGDSLTTFNVPDFRGLFGRMVDKTTRGQAGNDPDHATRTPQGTGTSEQAGSYEVDGFASHNHFTLQTGSAGAAEGYQTDSVGDTARVTGNTGIAETRPKNLYIIKMIKT